MGTSSSGNLDTNVNSNTGGAIRVTIAATVGQGNGGTSQPCRECWVSMPAANTGPVRMNIAAAASATVGIEVPEASSPFRVPVDDVSLLYFYSATNGDIIDILWRN
jgi:hypothetical protein